MRPRFAAIYNAGARLYANYSARVYRGTKHGMVLGATFAGASSVGTAAGVYLTQRPGDDDDYLKNLCRPLLCSPCYVFYDAPNKKLYEAVICPNPADSPLILEQYHQHVQENNHLGDIAVRASFGQYWPLIAVLPAAVGFSAGFLHGFFTYPAVPDGAEPLLQQEQQGEEKSEEKYADGAPDGYLDPATLNLMRNPVVSPCGHSIDASTAAKVNNKCPKCRGSLENRWDNLAIKSLVDKFISNQGKISQGEPPAEFLDPCTQTVMANAVVIPCGHSMDLSSAETCCECPIEGCGKEFKNGDHRVNYSLQNAIETYQQLQKNVDVVVPIQDEPAPVLAVSGNPSAFYSAVRRESIEMKSVVIDQVGVKSVCR